MIRWSNVTRVAALVVGAVVVTAGCQSGGGQSEKASATPTVAPVPTGYDPCKDIPQSVLDAFDLGTSSPNNSDSDDGTSWRGCVWANTGWGVSIRVTNATVDKVRVKNFQDAQEFTIGGRPAISTRQVPEHPMQQCTVNVQINGGSLEFSLTNSAASRTGNLNSCDLARQVAEKVVPTLPAGV